MTCKEVQFRLSTWANETHGKRETDLVEDHIRDCGKCEEFRSSVCQIEALASDWNSEVAVPVKLNRERGASGGARSRVGRILLWLAPRS